MYVYRHASGPHDPEDKLPSINRLNLPRTDQAFLASQFGTTTGGSGVSAPIPSPRLVLTEEHRLHHYPRHVPMRLGSAMYYNNSLTSPLRTSNSGGGGDDDDDDDVGVATCGRVDPSSHGLSCSSIIHGRKVNSSSSSSLPPPLLSSSSSFNKNQMRSFDILASVCTDILEQDQQAATNIAASSDSRLVVDSTCHPMNYTAATMPIGV
jgi:hypothetical protein